MIGPLVNERLPHDTVGPSNARELSEARRETLRSKVKEFFGQ